MDFGGQQTGISSRDWTILDNYGLVHPDLKFPSLYREWGFESLPGHHYFLPYPRVFADIFPKQLITTR